MPLPNRIRRPRFARVTNLPGLRLTPRDQEILARVHRFRFLDSTQIVRLSEASPQPILRRLQRLFHHGLLDRPRAQIDYFHLGGSRPMVYGLSHKGARALPALQSPLDRFGQRNVGKLHLQHTLLTSEILVRIEMACRRRSDVKFISAHELDLSRRFQWSVTIRHRGEVRRVGLIPDGVFALERADGSRRHYFLEADRGTMPVRRRSLSNSSFFRKLLAYDATRSRALHERRFGFRHFQVLTVTRSAKRAESLAVEAILPRKTTGLFLLTNLDSFKEDSAIFDVLQAR